MLAAFFKKYLKGALKARGDPDGWGLQPNTFSWLFIQDADNDLI